MDMLEALAQTVTNPHLIARPALSQNENVGYFIRAGHVWRYDRLNLGPDMQPMATRAYFPPAELLGGEWVVVARPR